MRVMETDTPDDGVRNIKYYDEGDVIRLTFQWPAAIEQVYIFKTETDFDIEAASAAQGRLFTLQEYKKLAGFVDKKTPGVHTYHIFPFVRDGGEDVAIVQTDGANRITCLTGQILLRFSIQEKKQRLRGKKINVIHLQPDRYIEQDALCYVKKENAYPADVRDGMIYFFDEPLPPGRTTTRQVMTGINEYIRIFVRDPEQAPLYKFVPM